MKQIQIKIKGISPFLFHSFNLESLTKTKKPLSGNAGNNPDEWKSSFTCDGQKLYVPSSNMHSAIMFAGKYVKVGRGTLFSKMGGAVMVEDKKIYFNRELPKPVEELTNEELAKDDSSDIFLDIRMVSNPNTKGKNARYRLGLGAGWELTFTCRLNDSIVSLSQFKEAVESLGSIIGFSNARTLGFGRFEIVEFKTL